MEGLTLIVADSTTGYFGVYHQPGKPKPYQAQVWRSVKMVHLGYFATAEEAALCVARSPEGGPAGGGEEGCSGSTTANARGVAEAGAGVAADAARGRESVGLFRRVVAQSRLSQVETE